MSEQADKPPVLYRTFEQVDAWQWASRATVEPLDVIRIDPTRYAHWIRDKRRAAPASS